MVSNPTHDGTRDRAPQSELGAMSDLRAPSQVSALPSLSEKLFHDVEPPLAQSFADRFERLNKYLEVVAETQRSVIDPSRQGIAIGSEIDLTALDPTVRVIIVGDIHGEVSSLKKVLTYNNNLEEISNGNAVLVLLGDLVHPVFGDPIGMSGSLRVREIYENLKIAYPHNVFTLVGNHDPLYEYCTKAFVDPQGIRRETRQSDMFRSELEGSLREDGGRFLDVMDYMRDYARSTTQAAYVMVANGAIATHAGPISKYSREEVRSCQPLDDAIEIAKSHGGEFDNPQEEMRRRVYRDACWSRWQHRVNPYTSDDVRSFLTTYGQPEGHLIVGHSPPRDKELWKQELLVRGVDDSPVSHTVIVASGQRALGYAVLQHGRLTFPDVA